MGSPGMVPDELVGRPAPHAQVGPRVLTRKFGTRAGLSHTRSGPSKTRRTRAAAAFHHHQARQVGPPPVAARARTEACACDIGLHSWASPGRPAGKPVGDFPASQLACARSLPREWRTMASNLLRQRFYVRRGRSSARPALGLEWGSSLVSSSLCARTRKHGTRTRATQIVLTGRAVLFAFSRASPVLFSRKLSHAKRNSSPLNRKLLRRARLDSTRLEPTQPAQSRRDNERATRNTKAAHDDRRPAGDRTCSDRRPRLGCRAGPSNFRGPSARATWKFITRAGISSAVSHCSVGQEQLGAERARSSLGQTRNVAAQNCADVAQGRSAADERAGPLVSSLIGGGGGGGGGRRTTIGSRPLMFICRGRAFRHDKRWRAAAAANPSRAEVAGPARPQLNGAERDKIDGAAASGQSGQARASRSVAVESLSFRRPLLAVLPFTSWPASLVRFGSVRFRSVQPGGPFVGPADQARGSRVT
ncbi:Hypothetical predicted protein [Olea europaea subsp. europaea]|uniref:Uncharacterized protein n=1 Tax=Olea europaea subsp. europaea TaxID=158383 RepID=A0A8S0TKA4_OLEEU|nr:Hypothetical predicted protein [Olea europaea subsp. europaea]